jgi:CubicO group peptidase (beta-lactamase class C family)
MRINRLLLSPLVVAIVSVSGLAQSPIASTTGYEGEVDAVMKQQMRARHIPGASVAVVSHGKVVLLKSYGLADVENQVPATPHTVYELASVTKQFTAAAIMMLVQDGKLSLDDPINQLLDGLPAGWNKITIRQLLNHTAGVPEFSKPQFHLDMRADHAPRDLIQLVANAPLDFTPGEKYSYSNTGYVLLGMLIEKLSGKKYGTFVRERIFEPLDMKDSRFNDQSAIVPNRARGYTFTNFILENADFTSSSNPYAAGGLLSSAADMAKWMQAQGSEKLLSRSNWEQMWTEARLNDGTNFGYGFGWNIRTTWSRKRVEHAGGISGFKTNVTRFIDDDLSVIYLLNSDAGPGSLGRRIFGLYLPATQYHPPKAIAETDTRITNLLRRVTVALSQGTGDPSWYTPKLQQYFFPDRIKLRKGWFDGLGPLQSFDLIQVKEESGRQKRIYRAVFDSIPMLFTYWLTPDHKIDDADFEVE